MTKQIMAPMKKPMGHHFVSRDGRGAPATDCMIRAEVSSARGTFPMRRRKESKRRTRVG